MGFLALVIKPYLFAQLAYAPGDLSLAYLYFAVAGSKDVHC